jgi:hypothetical protein
VIASDSSSNDCLSTNSNCLHGFLHCHEHDPCYIYLGVCDSTLYCWVCRNEWIEVVPKMHLKRPKFQNLETLQKQGVGLRWDTCKQTTLGRRPFGEKASHQPLWLVHWKISIDLFIEIYLLTCSLKDIHWLVQWHIPLPHQTYFSSGWIRKSIA